MNKLLMAYRSTPHTTTSVSPSKLLFGREIRTKVPCLEQVAGRNDDVVEKDTLMKRKGKVYADRKRRATDKEIETGDVVLVRNFKPQNKLSSPIGDKTSGEENQEQTYSRSRRECRAPKRFDEYLLYK